jgi:Domain of unknown function (DUF5658)
MVKPMLLAIFSALQVADVLTTNVALAMPGTAEVNPVMALSMAELGAAWWLPKAVLVVYVAWILRRIPAWPLGALTAINIAVVVNNLAYI